jgi:hypothetical protein
MTAELAQPIVIGPNAAALWQNSWAMESLGRFLLQDNASSVELFVPKSPQAIDRPAA